MNKVLSSISISAAIFCTVNTMEKSVEDLCGFDGSSIVAVNGNESDSSSSTAEQLMQSFRAHRNNSVSLSFKTSNKQMQLAKKQYDELCFRFYNGDKKATKAALDGWGDDFSDDEERIEALANCDKNPQKLTELTSTGLFGCQTTLLKQYIYESSKKEFTNIEKMQNAIETNNTELAQMNETINKLQQQAAEKFKHLKLQYEFVALVQAKRNNNFEIARNANLQATAQVEATKKAIAEVDDNLQKNKQKQSQLASEVKEPKKYQEKFQELTNNTSKLQSKKAELEQQLIRENKILEHTAAIVSKINDKPSPTRGLSFW